MRCIRSGDSPLHRSVMNFFPDRNFFIPPQEQETKDKGLLRHHKDCVDRTLFLLEAGAQTETRNRSD
jgi:hypothetical protein